MKAVVNAMGAVAEEFGYGESRGLMVADWVVSMQQMREREREDRTKKDAVSLAPPSHCHRPPRPHSPSLCPINKEARSTPYHIRGSINVATCSVHYRCCHYLRLSSPNLALSCVLSLDARSPSFLASHRPFASALWHCLPLTLRCCTA